MRIDNYMRIIPGVFVSISALLGFFHSSWWMVLTLFVGLNLFQYGFTDWCVLEKILRKLGVNE